MPDDKQIIPTQEELRGLGFGDAAQAYKNLELLAASLGPENGRALFAPILAELAGSANPDMALNHLERFATALADVTQLTSLCRTRHEVLRSLVTVFGASRFLSTFLIASAADGLACLAEPDYLMRPSGKAALREKLELMMEGEPEEQAFFRTLRIFRKRELLRIGLRDLLGKADLQETVTELSDLAEVCLQTAYERADAELTRRYGRPLIEGPDGSRAPAGFAVIAMGKLGGRELNFSSDVDLMYVYTADGETEGSRNAAGVTANRITNHQYFIKLAEKLTAAIGKKTEDGFVFRVDLRLRPEGQGGPLAQSLGGYEIYYESWGQTWERAALIKARPVAGDDAVGREFLERITPFVYRKYLDYSAIVEIRDMKQKINKDVEQKGRAHRDVKLGYGGIREIEFVIQALQLLYGGRDRSLRGRSTLKALHVLSQKSLITYEEHEALARAYVFLRTVEHRIQILDDLQTQTLPTDEEGLHALARRAGYRGRGNEAELLLRDHAGHTRKVRRIFDELFAFTGEETPDNGPAGDYGRLLDPETTEQEAVSLLGKLGFRDPGKAYRNLLLLREGPAFVHQTPRGRRFFGEIFPALFQEIVASPDPDMALNHLESFLAAQGSWESFQSLMKLDASAFKVLIAVFANSEYLSRMLVGRPVLLQNLLESRRAFGPGVCGRYAKELAGALEQGGDIAEKLDALRRFKHQEEIRLGMADLLNQARQTTVSRDLSKLAEICLGAALDLAAEETGRRYGKPGVRGPESGTGGLAIIGMGKLGGRELTYGSDLDILFLYSGHGAPSTPTTLSPFEYFSKVAEKTITYLSALTREGFVFRVDPRLRPTGSKGPLVQSLDAFQNYFAAQAETWELQALLRARFVAGDRAVGRAFAADLRDLVFRDQDASVLARDILEMRKRMEDELGKEDGVRFNIKQGSGGIVDIEFLVQYLQLLHGKAHRGLGVPGTYNALRALRRGRLLDDASYQILARAYLFLRHLESRLRIVANQATSMLSRDPAALSQLARRMGYQDDASKAGEKLLRDYELITGQVRLVFKATLKGQ
jgi:[glutamine synthetase] adenylyltransferase / [glutamine synthetase]-adenylyl-L-tyrosine phosphorylase